MEKIIRHAYEKGYLDKVVFVDDASKDGTQDVLKKFNRKYNLDQLQVQLDSVLKMLAQPGLSEVKKAELESRKAEIQDKIEYYRNPSSPVFDFNMVLRDKNARRTGAIKDLMLGLYSLSQHGKIKSLPEKAFIIDGDSYLDGENVADQLKNAASIIGTVDEKGKRIIGAGLPLSNYYKMSELKKAKLMEKVNFVYFAWMRAVSGRALTTISGGGGAYSTPYLLRALNEHSGQFEGDDAELSVRLKQHENVRFKFFSTKEFRVVTDMPQTIKGLWKQARRWSGPIFYLLREQGRNTDKYIYRVGLFSMVVYTFLAVQVASLAITTIATGGIFNLVIGGVFFTALTFLNYVIPILFMSKDTTFTEKAYVFKLLPMLTLHFLFLVFLPVFYEYMITFFDLVIARPANYIYENLIKESSYPATLGLAKNFARKEVRDQVDGEIKANIENGKAVRIPLMDIGKRTSEDIVNDILSGSTQNILSNLQYMFDLTQDKLPMAATNLKDFIADPLNLERMRKGLVLALDILSSSQYKDKIKDFSFTMLLDFDGAFYSGEAISHVGGERKTLYMNLSTLMHLAEMDPDQKSFSKQVLQAVFEHEYRDWVRGAHTEDIGVDPVYFQNKPIKYADVEKFWNNLESREKEKPVVRDVNGEAKQFWKIEIDGLAPFLISSDVLYGMGIMSAGKFMALLSRAAALQKTNLKTLFGTGKVSEVIIDDIDAFQNQYKLDIKRFSSRIPVEDLESFKVLPDDQIKYKDQLKSLKLDSDFFIVNPVFNLMSRENGDLLEKVLRHAQANGYLEKILIVDDASTDGTADFLRKINRRYNIDKLTAELAKIDAQLMKQDLASGKRAELEAKRKEVQDNLNYYQDPRSPVYDFNMVLRDENGHRTGAIRETILGLYSLEQKGEIKNLPQKLFIIDGDSWIEGRDILGQLKDAANLIGDVDEKGNRTVATMLPLSTHYGTLPFRSTSLTQKVNYTYLAWLRALNSVITKSVPGGGGGYSVPYLIRALQKHSGIFETDDAELSALLRSNPNTKFKFFARKDFRVITDMPETLLNKWKQSRRWSGGIFQVLRKYGRNLPPGMLKTSIMALVLYTGLGIALPIFVVYPVVMLLLTDGLAIVLPLGVFGLVVSALLYTIPMFFISKDAGWGEKSYALLAPLMGLNFFIFTFVASFVEYYATMWDFLAVRPAKFIYNKYMKPVFEKRPVFEVPGIARLKEFLTIPLSELTEVRQDLSTHVPFFGLIGAIAGFSISHMARTNIGSTDLAVNFLFTVAGMGFGAFLGLLGVVQKYLPTFAPTTGQIDIYRNKNLARTHAREFVDKSIESDIKKGNAVRIDLSELRESNPDNVIDKLFEGGLINNVKNMQGLLTEPLSPMSSFMLVNKLVDRKSKQDLQKGIKLALEVIASSQYSDLFEDFTLTVMLENEMFDRGEVLSHIGTERRTLYLGMNLLKYIGSMDTQDQAMARKILQAVVEHELRDWLRDVSQIKVGELTEKEKTIIGHVSQMQWFKDWVAQMVAGNVPVTPHQEDIGLIDPVYVNDTILDFEKVDEFWTGFQNRLQIAQPTAVRWNGMPATSEIQVSEPDFADLPTVATTKIVSMPSLIDPQKARQIADSIISQQIPFNQDMIFNIRYQKDAFQNNMKFYQQQMIDNLNAIGAKDTVLANLFGFLTGLMVAVNSLEPGQSEVQMNIPGDSRPVKVYLTTQHTLDKYGYGALTLAYNDHIELFLPRELFTKSDPNVFMQVIKHELDEYVYKTPHTLAVLSESVLNKRPDQRVPGMVSDRIKSDFIRLVETANTLADLKIVSDYFRYLVANEQSEIESIRSNPNLNETQKQAAIQLAGEISNLARFSGGMLEAKIAGLGGTIRGYKFLNKIGEGTFGIVYKAETEKGETVVIKMNKVTPTLLANPRELNYAYLTHMNDIRASKKLYPDTIQSGDFNSAENPMLVRPYMDGSTLRHQLDMGTLDKQSMVNIAIGAVEQFGFMHAEGVIYNDIKPSNIYLPDTGGVKIIDFGMTLDSSVSISKIADSFIVGDFMYASPEMAGIQKAMPALESALRNITASATKDELVDFIEYVGSIFTSSFAQSYLNQNPAYLDLANVKIPALLDKINTYSQVPSSQEIEQISSDLEKDLVKILYGMLDERSDIFSFGMVLYEMFAGTNPLMVGFQATGPQEGKKIPEFIIDSLRGVNVDFDYLEQKAGPEITSIVKKALSKEKQDRYQSFIEILFDMIAIEYGDEGREIAGIRKDSQLDTNDLGVYNSIDNITFGNIDETNHRQEGGLNTSIRKVFSAYPNTQPAKLDSVKDKARDIIGSLNYLQLTQNPQTAQLLSSLNIKSETEFSDFTDQLKTKVDGARIYLLPATEDHLLWVGRRYAGAHYGTFDGKDNVYITDRFAALLSDDEKAVVLIHEILHLAGLNHDQAEIVQKFMPDQKTIYENTANFMHIVADLESTRDLKLMGPVNTQRFLTIFSPAIKQAIAGGKTFQPHMLESSMGNRGFPRQFTNKLIVELNEMLELNARNVSIENRVLDKAVPAQKMTPDKIESLIKMLGNSDPLNRSYAADELIAMGNPSMGYLRDALSNKDNNIKDGALFVLGELGARDQLNKIIPLLYDSSPMIQRTAIETVLKIATEADAKYFQSMLQERKNNMVILASLKVLEKFSIPVNLDDNFYLMNPDKSIRDYAFGKLSEMGFDRRADAEFADNMWTLINNLGKVDTTLIEESTTKIKEAADRAVPYLNIAITFDTTVAGRAALILGEMGQDTAVPRLLSMIYEGKSYFKEPAEKILQNPNFNNKLVDLLNSQDPVLREQAAITLGRNKFEPALNSLIQLAVDEQNLQPQYVRAAAVQAVVQIGGKNIVHTLTQVLTPINDRLRRNSIALDKLPRYSDKRKPIESSDTVDRYIQLELAGALRDKKDRKTAPVLRELLWSDRMAIKREVILGLGEVGDRSDIKRIRETAVIFPELDPAAQEAVNKLGGAWDKLLSKVGLFVGGVPANKNMSSDYEIHKNGLTGKEQILEKGKYDNLFAAIKIADKKYSFKLNVDTDFGSTRWASPVPSDLIRKWVLQVLRGRTDILNGLNGRQINIALLSESTRISENHIEDNFIGINEAIFRIEDLSAFETMFKTLILHELMHEAGIAPVAVGDLVSWESKEFRNSIEYVVSNAKIPLESFVANIKPVFAHDSFFVYVLSQIAAGKIDVTSLEILDKFDLTLASEDLIAEFNGKLGLTSLPEQSMPETKIPMAFPLTIESLIETQKIDAEKAQQIASALTKSGFPENPGWRVGLFKDEYEKVFYNPAGVPLIDILSLIVDKDYAKGEYFYDLLLQLSVKLYRISPNDKYVALEVQGEKLPVNVIPVPKADLDKYAIDSLFLRKSDRIEMYLPVEYLSSWNNQVFFQILKRNIDEHIYGFNHSVAVLMETALNRDIGVDIAGKVPDRVRDVMLEAVDKARDLESLYSLSDYITSVVKNRNAVVEKVNSNPDLATFQKKYIVSSLDAAYEIMKFAGLIAETKIARLGGTIRGIKFEKRLGEGDFGIVFKGRDVDGKAVSVKMMKLRKAELINDYIGVQHALLTQMNEIVMAKEVYDGIFSQSGEFDNAQSPLLVYPYLSGETLLRKLDENKLSESELLDITIKIVSEFKKLHDKGIVYNDIRPANIFILDNGEIRIIDFGMSVKKGFTVNKASDSFIMNELFYSSPEMIGIRLAKDNFISLFDELSRSNNNDQIIKQLEKIKYIFTSQVGQNYLTANSEYNELVNSRIPSLINELSSMKDFAGTDYVSGIRKDLEPVLMRILYSLMDEKSDVYSFGLLLFRMFYGDNPINRGIAVAKQNQTMTGFTLDTNIYSTIKNSKYDFADLERAAGPQMTAIIKKALSINKEDRQPGFPDLLADLEKYRVQVKNNPQTGFAPAKGETNITDLGEYNQKDNVTFGNIDETDHRQFDGLNHLIQKSFDSKTVSSDYGNVKNEAKSVLSQLKYFDLIKDKDLREILSGLGIKSPQDFADFITRLNSRIDSVSVYELPSDKNLFWVGRRYAGAHFGKRRNSIYMTSLFTSLLDDKEKAVIMLHEILHLDGLNHDQAEKLQKALPVNEKAYNNLANFMHIIADIESTPELISQGNTNINRFLTIFNPAIKQSIASGNIFQTHVFEDIMGQRNFPRLFTQKLLSELNEMLTLNAQNIPIDQRVLNRPLNLTGISVHKIQSLIQLLGDANPLSRGFAVDELKAIGAPVAGYLAKELKNPNPLIRENSLYILGELKSVKYLNSIMDSMDDISPKVQITALATMIKIVSAVDVAFLQTVVAQNKSEAKVIAAITVLSSLNSSVDLNKLPSGSKLSEELRLMLMVSLKENGYTKSIVSKETEGKVTEYVRIEKTGLAPILISGKVLSELNLLTAQGFIDLIGKSLAVDGRKPDAVFNAVAGKEVVISNVSDFELKNNLSLTGKPQKQPEIKQAITANPPVANPAVSKLPKVPSADQIEFVSAPDTGIIEGSLLKIKAFFNTVFGEAEPQPSADIQKVISSLGSFKNNKLDDMEIAQLKRTLARLANSKFDIPQDFIAVRREMAWWALNAPESVRNQAASMFRELYFDLDDAIGAKKDEKIRAGWSNPATNTGSIVKVNKNNGDFPESDPMNNWTTVVNDITKLLRETNTIHETLFIHHGIKGISDSSISGINIDFIASGANKQAFKVTVKYKGSSYSFVFKRNKKQSMTLVEETFNLAAVYDTANKAVPVPGRTSAQFYTESFVDGVPLLEDEKNGFLLKRKGENEKQYRDRIKTAITSFAGKAFMVSKNLNYKWVIADQEPANVFVSQTGSNQFDTTVIDIGFIMEMKQKSYLLLFLNQLFNKTVRGVMVKTPDYSLYTDNFEMDWIFEGIMNADPEAGKKFIAESLRDVKNAIMSYTPASRFGNLSVSLDDLKNLNRQLVSFIQNNKSAFDGIKIPASVDEINSGSSRGFFLGGVPNEENFSWDHEMHKGSLVGKEAIDANAKYQVEPVRITIGNISYNFDLKIDADFNNPKWAVALSPEKIKRFMTDILSKREDILKGINGKQISLALLTESFRISENHLEDSFIGINESIFKIENPDSLETLFKTLVLHELLHESGLAPEGNELIDWESVEMRKSIEYMASNTTVPLKKFVSDITPAFAVDSFLIVLLNQLADKRITIDQLKAVDSIPLNQPFDKLISEFGSNFAKLIAQKNEPPAKNSFTMDDFRNYILLYSDLPVSDLLLHLTDSKRTFDDFVKSLYPQMKQKFEITNENDVPASVILQLQDYISSAVDAELSKSKSKPVAGESMNQNDLTLKIINTAINNAGGLNKLAPSGLKAKLLEIGINNIQEKIVQINDQKTAKELQAVLDIIKSSQIAIIPSLDGSYGISTTSKGYQFTYFDVVNGKKVIYLGEGLYSALLSGGIEEVLVVIGAMEYFSALPESRNWDEITINQHASRLQKLFGTKLSDVVEDISLRGLENQKYKPLIDSIMELGNIKPAYPLTPAVINEIITNLRGLFELELNIKLENLVERANFDISDDLLQKSLSVIQVAMAKPDIYLFPKELIMGKLSPANFMLKKTFRQFKREIQKNDGRKAIFVSVSLDGENTGKFKNELDSNMARREGAKSNELFDFIVTVKDVNELVDLIRIEYPDLTETDLLSRVKMIDIPDGKLAAHAQQFGYRYQTVDPKESMRNMQDKGKTVFMIDILRALGNKKVPGNLKIVDIRQNVSLEGEYQGRLSDIVESFDVYLSEVDKIKAGKLTYSMLADLFYAKIYPQFNDTLKSKYFTRNEAFAELSAKNLLDAQVQIQNIASVFMNFVNANKLMGTEITYLRDKLKEQFNLRLIKTVYDKIKSDTNSIPTLENLMKGLEAIGGVTITQDFAKYLQVEVNARAINKDVMDVINQSSKIDEAA